MALGFPHSTARECSGVEGNWRLMAQERSTRRPLGARMRTPQVAISGGGTCSAAVARTATALGSALAELGVVVICGGLGGVMQAVARGVQRGNGVVIGVLPGYERQTGNPYLSVAIPTGLGHGRNVIVAAAGDLLVALPGGAGTLSEIAFALRLGRPVIGLGAWGAIGGVCEVSTVPAAMRAVRRILGNDRRSSSA